MASALSHGKHTKRRTKVYQASRDGKTDDLEKVLEKLSEIERKSALETKTKDGDDFATPLIIAALKGNLSAVKSLLNYEAGIEVGGNVKIDGKIVEDCTPLWAAAAAGHLDVVKLLIERGAKVDSKDLTGSTPLRAAVRKGRLDIIRFLFSKKADVNAPKNDKSTPLFVACYCGHKDVVEFLIEKGAKVDAMDKSGSTALHRAMGQGHIEIADKLIGCMASASRSANKNRLTPLLMASNHCQIKLVKYFIKGTRYTQKEKIDALELLGATIANDPKAYDTEKALSFMKQGLEMRFSEKLHKKKMKRIAAYRRVESQSLDDLSRLEGNDRAIHMEGLIIRERILGTENTELCSPIIHHGRVLADSDDFKSCIRLWLHALEITKRCDKPLEKNLTEFAALFARMVSGKSALDTKVFEEVFEKLVSEYKRLTEKQLGKLQVKDAKVIEAQQERLTYCALYLLIIHTVARLDKAKNEHYLDLVQELISLVPRTHDGDTLLHLAACHSITPKDLHIRSACKLPCVETVSLLLRKGFEVNAVNSKGDTPLHVAVTFNPSPEGAHTLMDMLRLFIDYGANPSLENTYGLTAMDYCATDEARRILSEKTRLETVTVHPRPQTVSPRSCPQDPERQFTTMTKSKVTILAQNWRSPFSALYYLTKELTFQLAKHPQVQVSLLVPDKSLSEKDKQDVNMHGIKIFEAKAPPGFSDPVECLYFPPENSSTDVVVALDDELGKVAEVLKWHRVSKKRIQMVHNLTSKTENLCEQADLVVGLGSKLAEGLTRSLSYLNKEAVALTPGIFGAWSGLSHANMDETNFRVLVLSGNKSASPSAFSIALRAISSLKDRTFSLLFIGVEESERSKFSAECIKYRVSREQVIMKDFPNSDEDLKRLFCEVDLAILLSDEDDCGLIALCALSAGLPLYVCGESALATSLEEVPHGRASTIDSNEPNIWAKSIRKAKETGRKIRFEEAKNLRSKFEEKYNWKAQVDSLVKRMLDMFQDFDHDEYRG